MADKFKTRPLKHQLECLRRFGRVPAFANLAEQGTGKTWITINNAADLWASGDLNGVLVFAPSGVHYNWVLREIPKHMPDWVRHHTVAWSAAATKADKQAIDALFAETDASKLRIFVMNVEALQNKRGIETARRFAASCSKLMIVLDESGAFKNPKALRTKELFKLKKFSTWRRIMNGTPVSNGPFDAFSQFNFLDESILGTSSFYAFKAEYAEMFNNSHPLVQNVMRKTGTRFAPQIVARDARGRPKYRNLDKLSALIAPHSFRVLKKDCIDLPRKIYKFAWFDMEPEQRRIYNKAANENRLALDGEDTPFNKLVAQMKLMQITTGYFLHPDAAEPVRIDCSNPKLQLLRERAAAVIEAGEKLIVWARFRIQIEDVVNALREDGLQVVEYHGGINKSDRQASIEAFERGDAQVFVGQQQAGGRGLTLVAATNVFYFSNTYGLEDRLQSEDRAHRIGQEEEVVYTDFCARNSIDLECIEALRNKEGVAEEILNAI
jgi:SNF2 family DNA or RNA helicase